MDSAILMVLAFILVMGGAIYYEIFYPQQRHRSQVKRLKSQGAHRTLSADERKALSRYLSLSPSQYKQLLGHYVNRNDGWNGEWELTSDNVYAGQVVFEVKSIERCFIQNRFCQAGALRFNLLPLWEGFEGSLCNIELVMTNKLPVVISINGISLLEGMIATEHFIHANKAVEDFELHHHEVGQNASQNKPSHLTEEPQSAPSAQPLDGTYLPAGTPDEEESDDEVMIDEITPIQDDLRPYPAANTAQQQTDVHTEPQASHQDDTAHSEHDVNGIAIISTRKLSRQEGMQLYARLRYRILGILALILSVLLTCSGASFSDAYDSFTVVFAIALSLVMLAGLTLPYWIPRPQVKTVQGRLVLGHFHSQFPTLRSLGIGNLRIHLTERGLLTDDDLGKIINVDLTPNREVVAINGVSVFQNKRYTFRTSPLFLGLAVAALLAALRLNPSIINVYCYLHDGFYGPRRIELTTLDDAMHYQPQQYDVLEIKELPVRCELNDDAVPECSSLTPGQLPVLDMSVDKERHKKLAAIEQSYGNIRTKISSEVDSDLYYSMPSDAPIGMAHKREYVIPEAKKMAKALEYLRDDIDPRQYAMVKELLTDRMYSNIPDRHHPNDIVLKETFGQFIKNVVGEALQKENDKDLRYVHAQLAAAPVVVAPWYLQANLYHDGDVYSPFSPSAFVHPEPAFKAPEKTGYGAWDSLVDHLANEQGGKLTISGQVTDIKAGSPIKFSMKTKYHLPSLAARIASVVALLLLIGMLITSMLNLTRQVQQDA